MIIHIVQPGDNINSIANTYDVPVLRLIQDNGLDNPYDLVPGQTIVIVYPEKTYKVQEGDTLANIAEVNQVTLMELLRNNSFLTDRTSIYPGEELVIKYKTVRKIVTSAFAYPYISNNTLLKTLPYLTYLSVFNYSTVEEGNITAYTDDKEIIRLAKEYGVVPLMMATTLSSKGEPNIDLAYKLLLNEEYQDRNINIILDIMKDKGYYGVNMVFSFITNTNKMLYKNMLSKVSQRLHAEGFLFFITINTLIGPEEGSRVDFSDIEQEVDGIIIVRFVWGTNLGAPAPLSSIKNITGYIEYSTMQSSTDKFEIGIPIMGYDWELPYIEGTTIAYTLTINSILSLANDVNATIQFDEDSQTPFLKYNQISYGFPTEHIVWFTDARSINALLNIVNNFNLGGTGGWNIMIYSPQVWLITNSQYEIIKYLPDDLQ